MFSESLALPIGIESPHEPHSTRHVGVWTLDFGVQKYGPLLAIPSCLFCGSDTVAFEFLKPEYPKILTSKEWDKKKGVFAKMHGPTGIGEKMDEVQKLYDDQAWDKLNLTKLRENWRWGGDEPVISMESWNKIMKEAKDVVTGDLAKVSKALYELRDLASETQAKFKKSKTIPSSSAKYVGEVAAAADELGVKLNKNSMSEPFKTMEEEFLAFVQKNFLDVWPVGLKKYLAKHTKVMKELRENPTPAKFSSACQGMLRDYTTALGNIAKSHDKGFKIKNGPTAQKLFEAITPYSNLKIDVKDEKDVKTHLDKMDKMCTAVEMFAKTL